MRTLLCNGTVVTASNAFRADLLIDGETISAIEPDLSQAKADRTIDAAGRYLIPGGVDPHVHLELAVGANVSSDDFETGTRAAAPPQSPTSPRRPRAARCARASRPPCARRRARRPSTTRSI